MLLIGAISLAVNIYVVKKSNEKLKTDEMDKKLNKDDFLNYKEDHELIHERDRADVLYIRSRVDEIADHLIDKKK